MRTKHLFSTSTWLMPIVLCLGAATAAPQRANHPTIRILPTPGNAGARLLSSATLSPYFKDLQASFVEDYPTVSVNADGSDLWPCVGGSASYQSRYDLPLGSRCRYLQPDEAHLTAK